MTLILMLAPAVTGEILDRIAAVIDDRIVITLSDVRKERAIQSTFGRDAGSDDSILEALIERHFVDEQIAQFREIEVPETVVAERLERLKATPGISIDDLRGALIAEYRRAQFMIERFQQFIRVSDEELQKYYDEVYIPEVRNRGGRVQPLEEVVDAIRQNKVAEKMNEEVTSWLMELRRRSTVEKISN
ncbi:MAG TPA: hypothetical protein VFR18_04685 [Terriglobia bacterium]|nr:hypothetical protein [Terriglobia bacterium]